MPYRKFIFEKYSFDEGRLQASFRYSFDGALIFTERIQFADIKPDFNRVALDNAMQLAFFVIGTSYYKTFPSAEVKLSDDIDAWQAQFLNRVYQEGLSQFAFENELTREQLPNFKHNSQPLVSTVKDYQGEGAIALQSGGKDSLLLGALLNAAHTDFSALYVSSATTYPKVIDDLGQPVLLVERHLDRTALKVAEEQGGLNGHVPVTYIMAAIALVQTILQGKTTVLLSIGHEGEEPHAVIGDLAVMHQWSKTWSAEKQLSEYVAKYISPHIQIGSPLRQFSELKVAELFAARAWSRFGHSFSSCNLGNYMQGQLNETLQWCGQCPKCANNFLLFAPFVAPKELMGLFNGKNLFQKDILIQTFKGLLGVEGVMKPLECVGEVDELRQAYHMAQDKWGKNNYNLPFEVPASTFSYQVTYESQQWASDLIKGAA